METSEKSAEILLHRAKFDSKLSATNESSLFDALNQVLQSNALGSGELLHRDPLDADAYTVDGKEVLPPVEIVLKEMGEVVDGMLPKDVAELAAVVQKIRDWLRESPAAE